jgi:hypothetical protein
MRSFHTQNGASGPEGTKELLVTIVLEEATLFHTPPCREACAPREPYAVVRKGEQEQVLWPLDDKPFRQWLTQRFWERTHRVPTQKDMRDVLVLLTAMALDGEEADIIIAWIGEGDDLGDRPLADDC